jgi:hypothetical protein
MVSAAIRFGNSSIRFTTLDTDRVRPVGAPQNRANPVRRSSLNGVSQRASNPSGPKYAPKIEPAVAPNESVSLPWVN